MAAPLAFPKKDMGQSSTPLEVPISISDYRPAVGMGTTNQMRNLGGSIGIAIGANILSSTLSSHTAELLSPAQFKSLLGSAEAINSIPKEAQEPVRDAFARAFVRQMQAITGLGAAGLLCALLLVEQKPRFQQN